MLRYLVVTLLFAMVCPNRVSGETLAVVGFVGPFRGGLGFAAFKAGMEKLGYVDGKNVRFIVKTSGDDELTIHRAISAALNEGSTIIVAAGDNKTAAVAKRITSTIPIVFGSVNDPVESGIVNELARPGSNVTGIANSVSSILGKKLEIAKEIFPDITEVIFLTAPRSEELVHATEKAGVVLGVKIHALYAETLEDIERGLLYHPSRLPRVMLVSNHPLYVGSSKELGELAAQVGAIAFCPMAHMARAGCMLSYGVNLSQNYVRVAYFVDKLIKGYSPQMLPVELPMHHYLIINASIAKAAGIQLPTQVLIRADEVID